MKHLPDPSEVLGALRGLSLPDVCTAEVLAEHAGLSVDIIEEALLVGGLPGRYVHGRWIIARAALIRWLQYSEGQESHSPREDGELRRSSRQSGGVAE